MFCQASTANPFSSFLFWRHFPFSFVSNKWNRCSIGLRSADWQGYCITLHFFASKKLFICVGIAMLLIDRLQREALFLLFPLLWYKWSFIPSVHRMLFQKLDGVSRCCLANSTAVFEPHWWLASCGEPSVVPQDLSFLLIVDVDTPPAASMEMVLDLANCCEERERTLPSTSAVFHGLLSPSSLVCSSFLRMFQTVDTANDSAVSLMGFFWFVSI